MHCFDSSGQLYAMSSTFPHPLPPYHTISLHLGSKHSTKLNLHPKFHPPSPRNHPPETIPPTNQPTHQPNTYTYTPPLAYPSLPPHLSSPTRLAPTHMPPLRPIRPPQQPTHVPREIGARVQGCKRPTPDRPLARTDGERRHSCVFRQRAGRNEQLMCRPTGFDAGLWRDYGADGWGGVAGRLEGGGEGMVQPRWGLEGGCVPRARWAARCTRTDDPCSWGEVGRGSRVRVRVGEGVELARFWGASMTRRFGNR